MDTSGYEIFDKKKMKKNSEVFLMGLPFGKFSEAIILVNISLEVFVEEFMTEKYISEGKDENEARDLVDDLFDGKFHRTIRKAFFKNMNDDARNNHHIWIKFENLRSKRKQVMHPRTRKLTPQESYQVFIDFISVRGWIISLNYENG